MKRQKFRPQRLEEITDFDELMEKALWYRQEWSRSIRKFIEVRKRLIAVRAVLDGDVKVVSKGDDESVINLCNHTNHIRHI